MFEELHETEEEIREFLAAIDAMNEAKFSAYIKANPLPPGFLRGTLPTFWQTRIAMLKPDRQLKELTGKQLGQLGRLRVIYGEMARSVIAYAIDNWHRFASSAQSAAGLSCSPSEPHIGFLVTYHGIAGSMFLQSIAKPEGTGFNTD